MVKHNRLTAHASGFTLIELLVVLSIVAVLLTISIPRYFHNVDRGKEIILVENLRVTREVIDKFYGDLGRYPNSLSELVEKRYLKAIPFDPITDSAKTWIISPAPDGNGKLYELRSGAIGVTQDGTPFKSL